MNAVVCRMRLPWPPSINHYYQHAWRTKRCGRRVPTIKISDEVKTFRDKVWHASYISGVRLRIDYGICLDIVAFPDSGRMFDLDNILKATLDALGHAAVIQNDALIELLTVRRGERVKDRYLRVIISRFDQLRVNPVIYESGMDSMRMRSPV